MACAERADDGGVCLLGRAGGGRGGGLLGFKFQDSSVLEGLNTVVEERVSACARGLPTRGLGRVARHTDGASPTAERAGRVI